jgi:predicted trehalose synthase
VQTALARAGSRLVPRPIGSVSGHWLDADSASVTGHLAFAQEFLPGVEDAWRTALTAVEAGTDFSAQARSLGAATAQVHFDLARVMPIMNVTDELRATTVAGMRDRYRAAVLEVPELAEHAASVARIFDRAETAQWPALQRIHGDYHLGQVLNVPGRGWALVDFEGEPLKPLNERVRPDVPVRDVAGMLRSFAYAASTIAMASTDHEPAAIAHWAAACRTAFLEGYAAASGRDVLAQSALLDAFELDKAVYETVYETRNRPTWLPIPVAGVRALCAAFETAANAA